MPLLSDQVPQADSLSRVVQLTELLAQGRDPAVAAPGISPRQRSYYQRAAEVLGLLSPEGELLEAGRAALALPEGARWARLALAFEASPCGHAWCVHQKVADLRGVDPDSAYEFLSQASDLSESSCRRRAQTLRRWLTDLHPHHPAGLPTFEPGARAREGVEGAQGDLFHASAERDTSLAGVRPLDGEAADQTSSALGSNAELRSSLPVSDLEQDISRRLRTLLRTAPIHRLEGNKGQRALPLERYDLRSICLRVFDAVIAHMGMGSGLTRSNLVREMLPALTRMDPDAPPERHAEVVGLVLDGLLNERDRRQAFSEVSKPSGRIRSSVQPVATHVRPMFPALLGISGSWRTTPNNPVCALTSGACGSIRPRRLGGPAPRGPPSGSAESPR